MNLADLSHVPGDAIRQVPLEQFKSELIAQGVRSHDHFAFVCPVCKTTQSATSLIRAGAGADFDAVEKYLGFSCVGRFTGAGSHKKTNRPESGCNWTLGGLFRVHRLEVITDDGEKHPRFELAAPTAAQRLQAEHDQRAAA